MLLVIDVVFALGWRVVSCVCETKRLLIGVLKRWSYSCENMNYEPRVKVWETKYVYLTDFSARFEWRYFSSWGVEYISNEVKYVADQKKNTIKIK